MNPVAPPVATPPVTMPTASVPASIAPPVSVPFPVTPTATRSCDLLFTTIEYINCITLSNKTLTLTGTTAEDKALQWLTVTDKLLLPNSEANKTRLRQRFALLTLGFQASTGDNLLLDRAGWNLNTPNECNWYVYNTCKNGKVDKIDSRVYAITGTLPPDLCWLTALNTVSFSGAGMAGTLPTQLGWWTNLTSLDLASNKLSGTIPSTVSAWTALQTAYFHKTNLNGTMPAFGGLFCPKNRIGMHLYADCLNSTGQAKIACKCCDLCY
jgi:hypothetical protein